MSEKSCNCVGKGHNLSCPAVDTLFASFVGPKPPTQEVEQAKVEVKDESRDEVIHAGK